MQKLLLSEAKPYVAEILNMSPSDTRIVRYINEAIEYITVSHDWVDLIRTMEFVAFNGVLTLPTHVIMPLKFTVAGRIGQPYGQHYEYVTNGPGDGSKWELDGNNLVDLGQSPTTFDIDPDNPRRLVLTSDSTEVNDIEITIHGTDADGLAIHDANGVLGETIVWNNSNALQTTTNKFKTITQITKPVTKGFITVATQNESSGNQDKVLSVLHPYEKSPSYRRFKIHGKDGADTNGFTKIKGNFRIGYMPVYHDDDPLAINMITAIKLMAKAIQHYEHDEVKNAATLEGVVERLLRKQLNRYEVEDNIIDADDGYGNGDVRGV
jgi:hypothetical protein|tara:strand:- start:269 stop:1237 length:969 start_codon:yes stop_codon:yes gene_type:complete